MKRRTFSSGLACLVLLVSGYLTLATGLHPAYAQIKLQFWHNQSPQSIRQEAAELFSKRLAELTAGQLKLEIYPGGAMGDFMANLEGLKLGSNQFAAETPGAIAAFDPKKITSVVELPYLFETYEQAWAFMDSDLVKSIFEHLPATAGLRLIAVWENGFRHTTNNARPVLRPSDMAGLKVRIAMDPVMVEIMKALGANPVPMAFSELYTALQHGVVDAQENPIANIYFAKFFEVQKYLSLTSHQYSSLDLVTSERIWSQLTPEQRQAVIKAADEAKWFMRRKIAAAEDSQLKEMKAKRLLVNEVDMKAFRDAMVPVYRHFESVFGKEMVQRVLDRAAAIRAQYPRQK